MFCSSFLLTPFKRLWKTIESRLTSCNGFLLIFFLGLIPEQGALVWALSKDEVESIVLDAINNRIFPACYKGDVQADIGFIEQLSGFIVTIVNVGDLSSDQFTKHIGDLLAFVYIETSFNLERLNTADVRIAIWDSVQNHPDIRAIAHPDNNRLLQFMLSEGQSWGLWRWTSVHVQGRTFEQLQPLFVQALPSLYRNPWELNVEAPTLAPRNLTIIRSPSLAHQSYLDMEPYQFRDPNTQQLVNPYVIPQQAEPISPMTPDSGSEDNGVGDELISESVSQSDSREARRLRLQSGLRAVLRSMQHRVTADNKETVRQNRGLVRLGSESPPDSIDSGYGTMEFVPESDSDTQLLAVANTEDNTQREMERVVVSTHHSDRTAPPVISFFVETDVESSEEEEITSEREEETEAHQVQEEPDEPEVIRSQSLNEFLPSIHEEVEPDERADSEPPVSQIQIEPARQDSIPVKDSIFDQPDTPLFEEPVDHQESTSATKKQKSKQSKQEKKPGQVTEAKQSLPQQSLLLNKEVNQENRSTQPGFKYAQTPGR